MDFFPCECVARQQQDGSFMCLNCRGDIFACDCLVEHKHLCPYNPENNQKGAG